MSVWTEYSQQTPKGTAGSLYDLTSHVVDSFMNEENDGVMGYGVGVVVGTTPGTNCKLPATGATADKFLGIVMNGGTNEMNMNGVVNIPKGYHLSVMRQGRVWAKLADGQTPAYGGAVYLVINGTGAGCLKTAADGSNTIQIPARFLGEKTGENLVAIELYPYNPAASGGGAAGASSLGDLSDVDLSTPATDGQVLKYSASDTKWKPGTDSTGA